MLTEERLAKILQLLKEMETVSLGDLLEVIPASESTIRRDLTALIVMIFAFFYSTILLSL